ncbi:nadph-dependent fmn reductase [Candidatus Kaiserbacteria bacterium CG10_big_fil_rev_8_21_14_0_10_59_10]|uniref:Nadph-dependent fmn reductase n=1 Tax=Candidatus Kaiserbacteria bacterium CG10_big_fil_rev_8_21_14_0_10_59_10 TaxID=1974612 RepID=A0A2H0U7T5_9BACT|nr:MAG: nadph-dependent fmn reductase [Candidatus Kaiserbacteria bacterium CG10_big_fil_rev_8_21_14_0_10_59_10]
MSDDLNIKLIVGSTRPNRFSEHAAAWLHGVLKDTPGAELELLDLRDYALPFYEEPASPASDEKAGHDKEAVRRWSEKISEADGFVVVAPEYNRGYSAVLKNAFDYVWYPWNRKPIAFLSYGNTGGARAVEQMRLVSIELEMVPIRRSVHVMEPWNLRDDGGVLKAGALDAYEKSARAMYEDLLWHARALKHARAAK